MNSMLIGPDAQLPWTSTQVEDQRFYRFLRNGLIIFAVVAIVVPFLPVPEITREQKETLPPQLARVILEKKELPKPVPVKPKPKPVEEKKPEVKKEQPKEQPKPEPKPVEQVQKAREKAAISGVLAFQDDLADMRDSVDVADLTSQELSRGDNQAVKAERSIISAKAKAGSGGIQTAALSRDTGGAVLSGKEDTKVTSEFDKLAKQQTSSAGSEASGGRSDQAVRRVMDKNKGAIFAVYNRALRQDPTLQGKFVFELLIEPDGSISDIQLISSELNNPDLESKILSRLRLIRFPAGNIIKTRVNYSFDFLPY